MVWAWLREEGNGQANETIGAHLQKYSCQNHRTGRRGFGVRVRQPGVKRPDRDLDGEGDNKCPKSDILEETGRQVGAGKCLSAETYPFLIQFGISKVPMERPITWMATNKPRLPAIV